MSKVVLDMAMSLDGYIAGPNDEDGGLHNWYFSPSGSSAEIIAELIQNMGALVMGRRTYDVGASQDGFVETPFQVVHFVLTHQHPQTVAKGTTRFTFVTEGIQSALHQAKAAAGDKEAVIAGGANIVQQFLMSGLIDEIQIHLVPTLLGSGIRLFNDTNYEHRELENIRVIDASGVTHLRFRVLK